jgi:hypothetical protein
MKTRLVSVRLWSINRWLRWLGFRIFVETTDTPDGWTQVGLVWYGWSFARDGSA